MKEGKEREGKRREGAGLRRGKERACGADGWIDGQRRHQEIVRREGGLGAGKISRGKATKESHGQQWLQFVLLMAHGET